MKEAEVRANLKYLKVKVIIPRQKDNNYIKIKTVLLINI